MPDGLAGQIDAFIELLLAEEGRQVWKWGIMMAQGVITLTFKSPIDLKA